MRKKMSKKKISKRLLSGLLAVVLTITSVQYFDTSDSDVQAAPAEPVSTTQTGYSSLITYQVEKWNNILADVFKKGTSDGNIVSVGSVGKKATTVGVIPIPSKDDIKSNKIQVNEDSKYFGWKESPTNDPWNGRSVNDVTVTPRTEIITYAGDSVEKGSDNSTITAEEVSIKYLVYDVSTADELFYAMKKAKSAEANVNVKINLLADIDLNGQEQTWFSVDVEPDYYENSWYYIEGNGHTIYNMKTSSYTVSDTSTNQNRGTASFLGTLGNHSDAYGYDSGVKKKVVLKNLNFSNCLVFSTQSCTSVVVSFNRGSLYMENVNVKDSFVYSSQPQTGTLMGRQQSATGDTFLRNCSSQNCYVFGTDHSGGLTGCQHNVGINAYKVKYNVAFPNSPEAWMARHVKGNISETVFPEMVENCYSVDSELYSLGSDGDSGGLLSCGGKLICRNSFTNNIVYGNTRTGAFFGRIVTPESGNYGLYDDKGKRTVEIYFENCYASGSIEGISQIGGFVGLEDSNGNSSYGISVYKNCYTTAMVGMDYAGNRLGGFIGHENSCNGQYGSIKIGTENGQSIYNTLNGSVYINCYAAGEVGNILTDTSTTQSGTYNRLGGFLGEAGCYGLRGKSSYISGQHNGTYVNCYYDMQTTAMRERACGRADQFTGRSDYSTCANSDLQSQIPGVQGVYTQTSTKKGVQGLTDTNEIMGSSVWSYTADMYPMLNSFSNADQVKKNFGTMDRADQMVTSVSAAIENISVAEPENTNEAELENSSEAVSENTSETELENSETESEENRDEETTTEETLPEEVAPEEELPEQVLTEADLAEADLPGEGQEPAESEEVSTKETIPEETTTESQEVSTEETIPEEAPENVSAAVPEAVSEEMETVENAQASGGTVAMYDDATKARINEQLAKKVDLVQKYSQASVSTVLLSHWDSAMNMDTGTLDGETDWAVGLSQNRLTQKIYAEDDANKWINDKDGKYWEISYKQLAAGEYPLKIQAGTSWAYNFGSDKFNGANCILKIDKDSDVKIKFDYIEPASVTGENTNFRIWAEVYGDGLYNEDGTEKVNAVPTKVMELGANANASKQNVWTVVGEFAAQEDPTYWNPQNTDFDMSYVGTGQGNGDYELRKKFVAGTYTFKITRDHDWGESYGASGGADNMEFTIKEDCEVIFKYNENTHTTEVSTNPASALENANTEESAIDFKGYSVIAPEEITGYKWLENADAANKGKMTENNDGIYEVDFTLTGAEKFGKTYGYKVIKDARDEGPNSYFTLEAPAEPDDQTESSDVYEITLTFTYDPATGKSSVTCKDSKKAYLIDLTPTINSYGVLGSQNLTGLNWGKDSEENEVADAGYMYRDNEGIYYRTFENVPAGSHSFKVVANCSFTSGIDYGAYDGENYQFITTQTANIKIVFDETDKHITVTSDPVSAIQTTRYVISGNVALTGESWVEDSVANEMVYDDYKGIYTKTYEGLVSGTTYAFKIEKFGIEDKQYPESFQIAGVEGETYKLVITLNRKNGAKEYHLYDSTGKDVTEEYWNPAEITSWSVIGDQILTGYSWLGPDNMYQKEAAEKGLMTANGDGTYSVTFKDVKVTNTIQNMGFKVVAEGNWDTGISYGT